MNLSMDKSTHEDSPHRPITSHQLDQLLTHEPFGGILHFQIIIEDLKCEKAPFTSPAFPPRL
jgi:hypothetical protein